jgi:hypothetical protein
LACRWASVLAWGWESASVLAWGSASAWVSVWELAWATATSLAAA